MRAEVIWLGLSPLPNISFQILNMTAPTGWLKCSIFLIIWYNIQMKSMCASLYSFVICVISFASRVCANCLGEVAGLDLNCGGGHFKSPTGWLKCSDFLILWYTNSIQMKSLHLLLYSFAIRVIAFSSRVYASRCEVAGLDLNWSYQISKSLIWTAPILWYFDICHSWYCFCL